MIETYYRIDLRDILVKYREHQLLRVVSGSDIRLRKEVERLAYYFKRELHFDFLQYEATDNTSHTAYLFANEMRHIPRVWVGACCFRTRTFKDLEKPYEALQWIWIHPYYRNRGILLKSWSTLRKNHGDFFAEPPVSPAMRAFLIKHNVDSVFLPIYRDKELSEEETLAIFAAKCGYKISASVMEP